MFQFEIPWNSVHPGLEQVFASDCIFDSIVCVYIIVYILWTESQQPWVRYFEHLHPRNVLQKRTRERERERALIEPAANLSWTEDGYILDGLPSNPASHDP